MTNNDFEQKLRQEICNAARALNESGIMFAVFAETKCNARYWQRTGNGGLRLKSGANPSEAIRDIYENGRQYATECATAMEIVYCKAILEVYGVTLFNKSFDSLYLMDWDIRNPLLSAAGRMSPVLQLIEGDRGYFANPDHSPDLPQWQGENVIVLGNDSYYGHGIGIKNAESIINALNSRRKQGSSRSAYLMKSAGRPDFALLAKVMYSKKTIAVWKTLPDAIPAIRTESGHSAY